MSQQRYEFEVMRELEQEQAQMMMEYKEYCAEQEALPPHKREGYSEMMIEAADFRRKEMRENGK